MKTCVADTTPVCVRVGFLNQLAQSGSNAYSVERLTQRVAARSRSRARAQGAGPTPDWYKRILTEESLGEVHRLPYRGDPPTQDCYRDVDTTAIRGGECKALNILLVAMLIRLGIPAEIEWIMQPGMPLNHVTSIVKIDGEKLWADGSIRGARLGESPYKAIERTKAFHIVGARKGDQLL